MNPTAVVRPLPGAGLAARTGDLLLVCADSGSGVDELLGVVAEVAAAGGDGSILVRRVAALLAADFDGRYPACAVCGPAPDGRLAILVHGAATADIAGADGAISLSGVDAITSVNRLVNGPVTAVRLQLPGAGPADPRARLDAGVVSAAGVVYADDGTVLPPLSTRDTRHTEDAGAAGAAMAERAWEPPAPREAEPAPAETPYRTELYHQPESLHAQESVPAPESLSVSAPPVPQAEPVEQPFVPLPPVHQLPLDPSLAPPPFPPVFSEPADHQPAVPVQYEPPAAQVPAGQERAPAPVSPEPPVLVSPEPPPLPASPEPPPVAAYQPPPGYPNQLPPPAPHQPLTPQQPPPPEPVAVGGASGLPLAPPLVDEPAVDAPAMRQPDPAAPFVAVLLGGADDGVEASAGPGADPRPRVLGVMCSNAHFNDPNARYCALCGITMAQQSMLKHEGPRPPLGFLVLDDGSAFRLDVDYVLGREPQQDPEVIGGTVRPLRINDAEGIVSRRHARICLVGWDVQVVDLGSANGTFVQYPGDAQRLQLAPNQPLVVRPGTQVIVGRRWLRFESHRSQ